MGIKCQYRFSLVVMANVILTAFCGLLYARENSYVQKQYKRQGRDVISRVVDGNYDHMVEHIQDYLKKYPKDSESYFCLAILYSRLGSIDKALQSARQAVRCGLAPQRFIAGPRDLLQGLYRNREYQAWIGSFGIELVHGPLLGCMTDHSCRFWVRTAGKVSVQVLVSRKKTMQQVRKSPVVFTSSGEDYTAVTQLDGLQPNCTYYYRLVINGRMLPDTRHFRTFPSIGKKARFSIAFGGGAGYTPRHEYMWDTILNHHPAAFLFLGDNVYIDDPKKPDVQRYCYYRRQSVDAYRRLVGTVPIFAIWDDHDFTVNDAWGGPETERPAWKRNVWRLFRQNWNNPSYGGGRSQPGCWFRFRVADVDFIMLDGRYYRTDPKTAHPSMLGPVQKRWLLDSLKNADGRFKVIASPVPWARGTKPGSLDTWDGFAAERDEIFSFIERNRINGVILLSADRHRSDIWKISRLQGYDFYEFESSRLTNIHKHNAMKGSLFSYNAKCSFGELTFDTTLSDPEATYRIYNLDNELINTFTLKLSDISFRD